jgi:hypothetical protein
MYTTSNACTKLSTNTISKLVKNDLSDELVDELAMHVLNVLDDGHLL